MNRRILIIAGAVVVVIIIVALVVLGLRGKHSSSSNINIALNSNTNRSTNTNPAANTNASDSALRQRVVDFSERFESGPSGSENLRLLGLKEFLTSNLTVFAEAQARKGSTKSDGSVVAGRALTIKMSDQTATHATAVVDVQRTATNPTSPTTAPVVTYITVHLTLQKVGADWKVAAVTEEAARKL